MPRDRYHVYSADEIEQIRTLTSQGYTASRIASTMGLTSNQVNSVRQRYGIAFRELQPALVRPVASYTAPTGPTLAEVYAPEASRDETDEEFLARVLPSARASVAKAEAQRHALIRIASKEPVALVISSDWHASTTGTDVDGLLALADAVADAPNVYSVAVGDLLDNPIKHKGSNVHAIADQLRLADIIVGRYRGKLLGTTSGNHDDWSKVLAGTDHLAALATRHRIHYAPDEIIWRVEIVDPDALEVVTARYIIATRHQWRRHSNLNPLHACWTWLQEQQLNWTTVPDVLAIGHNHVAAHGAHNFAGRDVWGLRMGAWQIDSSYARAKGFANYRPTAPVVVMPPVRTTERSGITCYSDLSDALTYMRGAAHAAA